MESIESLLAESIESWSPLPFDVGQAACVGRSPHDLFFSGTRASSAKRVCEGCPVRWDCLMFALDTGQAHGVWGGLTTEERKVLEEVTDEVLEAPMVLV